MSEIFDFKNWVEQEEEYKREIIEFYPNDLIGILRSADFQSALSKAADVTKKTGHEAGFEVGVLPDKTIIIPEIKAGMTDSMMESEVISQNKSRKKWNEFVFKGAQLLDFHFHPSDREVIVPSGKNGDLSIFTDKESVLMGVGKVDGEGNVEILVIKRKRILVAEDIDEYDESSGIDFCNQETVNEILEKIGLQPVLIKFAKLQGRKYELDGQSEKAIEKIGKIKINFPNKSKIIKKE